MANLLPLCIFFDLGVLVLIWLVQLVIYPSFRELEPTRFRAWHRRYSFRVSFLVIPLMFGQLGISVIGCSASVTIGNCLHLVSCLVAWAATFLVAVPLHRRLGREGRNLEVLESLVRFNWIRTAAWTSAAAISLERFFS